MTDRYWIGGSATWQSGGQQAANRWSPSGVPTSADNVFFDASAGAVNVTVGSGANCANIIMTGFTGTLTGTQTTTVIDVYGSEIVLSNYGTFDSANYPTLRVRSGAQTNVTTMGQTVGHFQVLDGSTAKLVDNLIGHNNMTVTLLNGTLDANNKNVAIGYFSDNNDVANTKILTMGSGTWNIMGEGPVELMQVSSTQQRGPENAWYIGQPSVFTLNKGTSKLRFLKGSDAAGLNVALTNSPSETSITVHESAGWPSSGRVLIDDEEIEYSALSSNVLTISKRGANGTALAAHAEDAPVMLLSNPITTLTTSIADETTTSNVVVGSTSSFPTAGTILIDGEIIRYYGTSSTDFGSNTFNTVTYTLTRGVSNGASASAHTAGTYVRHVEARNFYGGGLDYNIIDFYNTGGYTFTFCYGGFSAAVVQSGGQLGIQNIVFDGSPYSTTEFYLKGSNQQPIYMKNASWSSNTARQYNVAYYSTGNPGTNALSPYIDTKSGDFVDLLV